MGARNSKAKAAVNAKTQGDDELHKQNKEVKDMVYRATLLSIGYAIRYDEMFVLIPKNTRTPTKKFEWVATTTFDNQEAMTIPIYQGERKKASANQLLGTLVLKGIQPAPRCVAQITISLAIDAKGNLNVSAHENSTTGKKVAASMSIPGVGVKGKLASTEEVEKMARQGEKHKSEDEEHLEKMKIIKEMEEHAIMIRKNAAAGGYSGKAHYEFKKVAEKMLDEFEEKAKEFGSEGAAVLSTT